MSFSFYYVHFLCVFCFRNNHFLISYIYIYIYIYKTINLRNFKTFIYTISAIQKLSKFSLHFLSKWNIWMRKYYFLFIFKNNILLKMWLLLLPTKHDIDLFMFAWEICLRKYCFYFVSISFIFLICKKYKKVFFFAKWINDAKFVFHICTSE